MAKQILSAQQNASSSLDAAIAQALSSHQLHNNDNMLPAVVISYDRAANLVTCRPLIQVVLANNVLKQRNPLTKIHALSIGAGNFHINFPIKPGDLGWICAADRDLTKFRDTLAEAAPNSDRAHTFSDGLFIPDVFRKYTINGEDSDAMVIQSTDSKTRISIRGDNIKITAPSKVTVDVPQSEFTGNVTIDKNLIVTGKTDVNGGFTAKAGKACSLPTETTVAGKKVDGHTHTNPEGGNVGPF